MCDKFIYFGPSQRCSIVSAPNQDVLLVVPSASEADKLGVPCLLQFSASLSGSLWRISYAIDVAMVSRVVISDVVLRGQSST